jgi:short-subunit dehydrogenase
MTDFRNKYGPWALVAGGAQGIGAAYAHYAAARGLDVAVIDIHQGALDAIRVDLETRYGVECLALRIDLGASDMLEQITAGVGERAIGLLVYNAAIADVGPFFKPGTGLDFERKRIAINVSGPLVLTWHFGRSMLARRRGGIVLMSSGSGLKGAPYYAAYAATKAYTINLGQSLWHEFKPYGVDVLAVAGGMTLSTAAAGYQHLDTSTFQTSEQLVDEAMEVLGKQPLMISGEAHRAAREQLDQLPDEQVIAFMAQHAIDNFLGGKPPEQAI